MSGANNAASDPRTRHDGLGQLTRAIFPDSRVRLEIDSGWRKPHARAGWTIVSTYAVVPSAERPRFLVPLEDRRVAAASLLAYNALRPPRVRAARAAIGWSARLGALSIARTARLTVSIPIAAPAAELVLTEHLACALGANVLYGACGVRPLDANYKPTLQLFDERAHPVGFAKVGWSPATRALVRTEADALRNAPRSVTDHPLVPGLKLATDWGDRTVTVVEPLPIQVRALPEDDPPRVAAILAVARRGGAPRAPRRLDESAFIGRLRREAAGSDVVDVVGDRLARSVDRFAERHGATVIEFAAWHGDWVPWNLGIYGCRLVAWDWEHSGDEMPLGSDLAHEAFQRTLQLRRLPYHEAITAAKDQLVRSGSELGLDASQNDVVLIGYLIEMWLRMCRLASGGGDWNSALHPGLLDGIEGLLAN